ncbi:MAG: clan AA aspartic protease [Rhodospirillaceae bacterium]|nr:clan AA aspartic protease [Rhodospirillaceae bacterium]
MAGPLSRRTALAFLNAVAFAGPTSLFARLAAAQDAAPPAPLPGTDPGPQLLGAAIDKGARMSVPISIGGQGPFPFIVDTALERTIIATELAAELKLADGPRTTIHTMTGRENIASAMLPPLEVNGVRLAPKAAPKFSERNIGAKGVLGIDALKSQRIVLNLRTGTMTMNADPVVDKDWEGETITVTARSKLGQLVLTNAGIGTDDDGISVIINTGSETSVGNQTLKRFMQRTGSLSDFKMATLISITGESTPVDWVVVKRLRVGGMVVANLPIAFTDAQPFRRLGLNRDRALLLGMDVLKLFDQVALNFQKRTVQFFWQKPGKSAA